MKITLAGHDFNAVFEDQRSPATCAAFRAAMPFASQVVHPPLIGRQGRSLVILFESKNELAN